MAVNVFPVVSAKLTPDAIRAMKSQGRKVAALTTYDYPMTRWLDETGVPLLLVGDSLGMVVLGYPDTTHVTLSEMEHHVRAAARAQPRALLAADLPFGTYTEPAIALESARRLIAAGAEAVKAEGGEAIMEQVRTIVGAGIPFLGHLGMLPQQIHEEGRYRIKGRDEAQRQSLLADAEALEAAGAFGIVLELVTPPVAEEISRSRSIPTLGIGSGPHCDGQILVTMDLVGMFPWFTPKFVQRRLEGVRLMQTVVRDWMAELNP